MRKILMVIVMLLISGCMIANTPTSLVEEYLGKYQRLDDDINISYIQLSIDENIDNNYKERYKKLIEKQYKSLAYEVKDEEIDGDMAYVTVQIEVYDYKEILDRYEKHNYDDLGSYHKIILDEFEKQKDKITYTINFEVGKNDKDEWEVLELSLDDYGKLLGII